jgi:DNA-binding IscR family transcriptional regulator
LNYTIEYCPFESISDKVEINQDSLEKIILKLKNA